MHNTTPAYLRQEMMMMFVHICVHAANITGEFEVKKLVEKLYFLQHKNFQMNFMSRAVLLLFFILASHTYTFCSIFSNQCRLLKPAGL